MGIPEKPSGEDVIIEDETMTKRQYALLALLSSERSYASNLFFVRDICIPVALGLNVPLANTPLALSDCPGPSASFEPPMTFEDVRILFRNIAEMATFTDVFVKELEVVLGPNLAESQGNGSVGELFLHKALELERLYKYYITRHKTAFQHLQNLSQTSSMQNYLSYTQIVFSSISPSPTCDLASLLAKPMQRLLQYVPLLTDILNQTPDAHPDKDSLRGARATLEEIARTTNYARQRVEVVKGILASKSMKRSNSAIGGRISKAMSTRYTSVRAAITGTLQPHKELDERAAFVETLQAELKRIESFGQKFAKDVVDFGKMTSNMMLTMQTWSHSFGAILEPPACQDRSEVFDAFLNVVERGLIPLSLDLEKTINKRILKDLSYLLMTMNQPLKVIASMIEHQSRHFQLLHAPIDAKIRPPNLLAASYMYTALRDQLAEELPTYIRLLDKGLATLVRRLAEIQTTFWDGVRNRWIGLYDMLFVESEHIVDGEETCAEWQVGWATVDQLLRSLTIMIPQDMVAGYLMGKEKSDQDAWSMVARHEDVLIRAKERGTAFGDRERFLLSVNERNTEWTFRNSGTPESASTRPRSSKLAARVSIMAQIEEEQEDDFSTSDIFPFITSAQMHEDETDGNLAHSINALTTNLDPKHWKPTQTSDALRRSTERVQTGENMTDRNTTWSNEDNQTDARPLFSVQSFEPQVKGASSDMIVTVGMAPADSTETLFMADISIPSSPSRSRRLSFHSAMSFIDSDPDNFLDRISEYRASSSQIALETGVVASGKLKSRPRNQGNHVLSSRAAFSGNWDRASVMSRETFETAEEPPPELLLALGLHPGPISPQTPSPTINRPYTDVSRNASPSRKEESVNSEKAITNSSLYNISFIRDVSNVYITGSHINFTTNIVHCDDHVRVGLHTLYLRSDPTALHNSYERQKRVNQQVKAVQAWGSQLLLTSSSTLGEYPLSVPSIKTHDLEAVVKDVFTWLYAVSSHSIMWLYDEHEGDLRTSLVAQCLANFLGERQDLTASYFYTKHSPSYQVETTGTYAGPSRKDNPSSIIPTLAFELTRHIPEIQVPIALTAANDLLIFDLSLEEQMKRLIIDPLQAVSHSVGGNSCKFPQLFLIHGLEDCNDDDFQELFLRAFGKSLTLLQRSTPQKLILLGRWTSQLQQCFSVPELQGIVRHRHLPVS